MSYDLARPYNELVIGHYRQEHIKVMYQSATFGSHRRSGNGDICFSFSRYLTRQPDQKVVWIYGWEPLMVNHYTVKFGGHRHCDGGDIMSLVV